MSEKITALAATIISELEAIGDPIRAEGETRYFKETVTCLGTGAPQTKALEKRLCAGLAKTWSVGEAMQLCDVLLEERVLEVTSLALEFLSRFVQQMGEREFLRCEQWLADDLCDNWASTDSLGPHILGPILHNHPHLVSRVKTWTSSPNRWLRRASAVSFILLARKGKFLDAAYEIGEALLSDKTDDLVQKGNGWMLREAGKTDLERLERFLLLHGPNIPRTTLRYAIERFPKEKRDELLRATRL